LKQHGKDELHPTPRPPDVVVFPSSTEEISEILKFANAHKIPVTPFGVGSSLEGNAIPIKGGISIDLQMMNSIVDIRPQDFLVKVQPGVTKDQLNNDLKKHGMFFSVDTGADATIGGMVATNASGTTSVRYGVMEDQVRGLEVVLADGSIIKTGGMYSKSSSGYNLTKLFVGSEGTLGVFSEITLRIHGIPEYVVAARAEFSSINKAVNSANSILSAGVPVARMELVDDRAIKQVNKYCKTSYEETATLFLEFHGNEAGLNQDIEFTKEIIRTEYVVFNFETDVKKRNMLWESRHNLAYAFLHDFPTKKMIITDVCLPLSELADAIIVAKKAIDTSGLDGAVLGHIGDGNFHTLVMVDPEDESEVKIADRVNKIIVEYALGREGTCTGEHGVGIEKRKYQWAEHGESIGVMKSVKKVMDPHGILNPGKLLPE